jgi:hypothetical protein
MKTEPRYARCKIFPGLFGSEVFVVVSGSSAYVDRSNVRWIEREPEHNSEVEGEVLVYVVDESAERDDVLVQLPGEAVIGGLRTRVPRSLLASV